MILVSDFSVNTIVTGCVTGIEEYGIFVSLDNYYSGLIHISEISDNFVRNISDYVNIGETIKVKILAVDENKHHLKLSIKNIDYRIVKKNKFKIKETNTGFRTLKVYLDKWIVSKKQELLQNKAIRK